MLGFLYSYIKIMVRAVGRINGFFMRIYAAGLLSVCVCVCMSKVLVVCRVNSVGFRAFSIPVHTKSEK